MKKAFATLFALVLITIVFVSCQKDPDSSPPDTQPLKTVKKVAGSVTDFIQYEYNAKGHVSRYVSQWRDAAGTILRQNNVFDYNASNQLVKWTSEAGTGFYAYQNGRLSQSEHFAANGKKIATLHYAFNASNRLITVIETIANPLPNGPQHTKISYQYYPNGNLSRMDFAYRNEPTDPFTLHFIKKFVEYDDKKNPEPDGVLGSFLPGISLLYNNPVRIENVSPNGVLQGYNRYEYTYNAEGLPVQRKQFIATNNVEAVPLLFTYEY